MATKRFNDFLECIFAKDQNRTYKTLLFGSQGGISVLYNLQSVRFADESYDVTQDDQNKDEAVDGFGSNNDVVYVNTEIRGKDSDEAILCCDNNFGLPLYAKPLQKHDIPNPHKATDIYGSVTFNGGELVAKQFHHDKETSVTNNEGSESLLTPSNDKSTGKRVTGRKDVWKKEQ